MKTCIIFFLVVFSLVTAAAQESPATDSTEVSPQAISREVCITARRQWQENFRLPVVTNVLDPVYLNKRTVRSVPEMLFGAPGIFLQKTNQGGGSPFLRGLTGQQTLLLVDGIRINNATFRSGPNQYLNTLDPFWISRVEILESSGSVEYGSDAIGGVVQVFTKAPEFSDTTTFKPEANFQWGSGGMETSGQAALQASGRRWAVRAGGAYRQFGDLIAGKGLGKESPNGYDQWSVEAKALFRVNRRLTLTAAYQDLQQNDVPVYHKVILENFKYNRFDPQRRQFAYARLQSISENKWWRKTEWTISRQFVHEVRENQKNGNPVQVTETDKTSTNGLQFNVLSSISAAWDMNTGAEWYGDAVRSDKSEWNENTQVNTLKRGLYPDRATMQTWAAYNLHSFTWKRFFLTGGLRYNYIRLKAPDENIGNSTVEPSALVGNLGLSCELLRGLRVFANAASAFRAPNVDDLGTLGIVDFRYELPNYGLQPEKSRSYEAGLKMATSNWKAGFSAYHLHLDGLIGRVRTRDSIQGYAVYRKENLTEAYVRGLEFQAEWKWHSKWLVSGHATYTFGQNTTAGEPLRRIPPFNGRVYVQYTPWQQFELRAESIFAADQRRLAQGDIDDNRIADNGTPGWYILNLTATYRYRPFQLTAEVHNILNEAYRTHGSGVDGIGRSLWLRCSVQF
ncbi:MAG TPA: TonB-dependent receptor [Saprospiraceae bacterium]|nr:TonB-dependent receptor [Saprospiraceae bacterium]HPI06424.1 TonB-dependent receptor [Saprospiraceae bacterium]